MTDHQLETRLRTWYRSDGADAGVAPMSLRASIQAIPETTGPGGAFSGFMAPRLPWSFIAAGLLVVALLVGLAVAVGSGLLRPPRVPPPTGPAANGLIAFEQGGDIYVGDPITGAARPILAGPDRDYRATWSADGRRVAILRWVGDDWAYVTVRADGSDPIRLTPAGMKVLSVSSIRWSPDGSAVAFDVFSTVWVAAADGSGVRRLNPDDLPGESPAWSPDSRTIVFRGGLEGSYGLYLVDRDGTGLRFVRGGHGGSADYRTTSWSPDGTRIAFAERGENGQRLDIHVMNADGSGDRVVVAGDPGAWAPLWSPDGTRLAYLGGPADPVAWRVWVVRDYGDRVPVAVSDAFVFEPPSSRVAVEPGPFRAVWAPDGTTILAQFGSDQAMLLLDPAGGPARVIPWVGELEPGAWQRLAP